MPDIVTGYGAVADGGWAQLTLTISNGDATLVRSAGSWPVDIAGKGISIGGVDRNAAPFLTTTVASRTNNTTIELGNVAPSALSAVSRLVTWGTNNIAPFQAFAADYQGDTVALTIPAGTFYLSGATSPIFSGIANLTVTGAGLLLTEIVGEGIYFGNSVLYQDNTHSSRTATAFRGQSYIDLLTPSQHSRYSVGQVVQLAGIDLQGLGFPHNPHYFEWLTVAEVDSDSGSPTYGRVTFTTPLQNSYLSTWPLYNGGSAFEIDCGGPATLYAIRPEFDATHVYNDFTFVQQGQSSASGRNIELNRVKAVGPGGIFPTVTETWAANDCDFSACTIEVDKIATSVTFHNTNVNVLQVQSSSVDLLTISGTSHIQIALGSPKELVVTAGVTIEQQSFGPTTYGRCDEISLAGATINAFIGGISYGGVLDKGEGDAGINNTAGVSMSGGVITIPATYRGTGPVPWAIPGGNCFLSDENNWAGPTFRIISISRVGGNTLVKTNLSGGFPSLPNNATKLYVFAHPAPKATFRSCAGANELTSLNQAPARAPLWSWQKFTYTSGVAQGAVQPKYPIWGDLVRLTATITNPYSGVGALTFRIAPSLPVIEADNNPTSTVFYEPQLNAKMAGTRVVTKASVANGQTGDQLTVADAVQWWITGVNAGAGPSFSADASGTEPNVTVDVLWEADQRIPGTRSIGLNYI